MSSLMLVNKTKLAEKNQISAFRKRFSLKNLKFEVSMENNLISRYNSKIVHVTNIHFGMAEDGELINQKSASHKKINISEDIYGHNCI